MFLIQLLLPVPDVTAEPARGATTMPELAERLDGLTADRPSPARIVDGSRWSHGA